MQIEAMAHEAHEFSGRLSFHLILDEDFVTNLKLVRVFLFLLLSR